jgi:transketolase
MMLMTAARNMRKNILTMLCEAKSGHPGGSLSIVEIVAYLFLEKIKRTKENGLLPDRDRVVLSKGHAVPALYAVFAEIGILKQEDLKTLRKAGSILQGHPDCVRFPYVEASTGSLGQGLSVAQGMAMAAKLNKRDSMVYCITGDGETQEGQIWEALMSAPKFKLDNLVVFLDYNKGQIDGTIDQVMPLEPVKEKIRAFNWDVFEIDGHNFGQIEDVLAKCGEKNGRPKYVIANTIKGKSVSFMEGQTKWHGVAPTCEELEKALVEVDKYYEGC